MVSTELWFVHFESPPRSVDGNLKNYRLLFDRCIWLQSNCNSWILIYLSTCKSLQIYFPFFLRKCFIIINFQISQSKTSPHLQLSKDSITPPTIRIPNYDHQYFCHRSKILDFFFQFLRIKIRIIFSSLSFIDCARYESFE